MARAPDVIVDDSPRDTPTLNVPLRVGWLLRTCRLNSRVRPGLSGHSFAASLGVGPAMVTKWEKGSDAIDAAGMAGYEALVDLPPGSLRGLVETTRRYFRHPVSPRLAEEPISHDLQEASDAVRPAMAGAPHGLDWLHLADALAEGGPIRLPDFVVAPILHGLVDELSRSVRGAFLSRFEAVARLRTGPYARVALDVLLDRALTEDTQASAAALIGAAQLPSGALFADMTRQLVDPREGVHHGAAHALVTMTAVGVPKGQLRDAVPAVVAAYNQVAEDPARHGLLSAMLRNLPRGVLEAAGPQLTRPLRPVPELHRGPGREHLAPAVARGVAERIKAQLPTPEDHVLERVIGEALFDPRWPKAHVATLFLSVLPYADLVAHEAARLVDTSDHPEVREAAALLVLRLGQPSSHEVVTRWVEDGDHQLRRAALVTLGRVATEEIDEAVLRKLAAEDWSTARLALYAAGMTRSPLLHEWVEEPATPPLLRRGAAWWRRHGGRIVD